MRKIITNTFVTLDGIMQAPGGPEEDPTGNFMQGGWAANYFDEKMMEIMTEFISNPFELLLGRITYEIFAAHWPYAKEDPMAPMLNNAKKYVVSHTLKSADWINTTLISGDAVQGVKKIKEQEGPDIQVHGSGKLIQTLLKHNLIDQFNVWIFPIVIGNGKRLFAGGTVPSAFKLVEFDTAGSGVLITKYKPAGVINTGSFEFPEPTQAELDRRKKLKMEEQESSMTTSL